VDPDGLAEALLLRMFVTDMMQVGTGLCAAVHRHMHAKLLPAFTSVQTAPTPHQRGVAYAQIRLLPVQKARCSLGLLAHFQVRRQPAGALSTFDVDVHNRGKPPQLEQSAHSQLHLHAVWLTHRHILGVHKTGKTID
jgi:hypothetical protein